MWVIEKEAGIIGLERGIQTRFRSRALCSGQSIGTTGDDWRGERGEPHHRLRSAALHSNVSSCNTSGINTITYPGQAVTLQPQVAACLVVCLVRTAMLSTTRRSLCSPFHMMTSIPRATRRDAAGPASSLQCRHGKHLRSSHTPPQTPIKKKRRLPQTLRMAH